MSWTMRPKEAATVLGVDTRTLARWCREGKLRAITLPGGHRRYDRVEIQERIGVGEPEVVATPAASLPVKIVRTSDNKWIVCDLLGELVGFIHRPRSPYRPRAAKFWWMPVGAVAAGAGTGAEFYAGPYPTRDAAISAMLDHTGRWGG